MIFARKINKIPYFYAIFAGINARILHKNCPKKIFPNFGGTRARPVSYAIWTDFGPPEVILPWNMTTDKIQDGGMAMVCTVWVLSGLWNECGTNASGLKIL